MKLFQLYSCNISVQYKNTLCSKATFFVIVTTLIAIIFPLILSYRTRGFWLKNYTFYEQPKVNFKYQYAFMIETEDPEYFLTCGNLPNLTIFDYNNCTYIKVQEIDYNHDKKTEELLIDVSIDNSLQKNIKNMKMILILEYKLTDLCPLQMEGLIFHEQSFISPIAKYFLSGNLKWIQISPLPCLYNYNDIRYNYSTIMSDDNKMDNWLQNTIYEYSRRNVSTILSDQYNMKTHGISSSFNVEISITIPEHDIRYKPGIWQELKFSWMQYFSIAIIFFWILSKINGYVFNNRILPAWKNDPLKEKLQ